MQTSIMIYTDGSCHTQHQIGGWAAILFINEEKIILSGTDTNTTHQRMELVAVIKAIEYIQKLDKAIKNVHIISDSQYIIGLTTRADKLADKNFITKKGNDVRNMDLVKIWLAYHSTYNIELQKIKAHQKQTDETMYNIEVDKISRKLVRDLVREIENK